MRRGKRGRDVAKETRERRILESRRIFWTDEKGEINTEGAIGDRREYSEVVRESLGREEIGIPILLQIGDEVEAIVLSVVAAPLRRQVGIRPRTLGGSCRTGRPISTP